MFQKPRRDVTETYPYSDKVTQTARRVIHAEIKRRQPRTISGIPRSAMGCYSELATKRKSYQPTRGVGRAADAFGGGHETMIRQLGMYYD